MFTCTVIEIKSGPKFCGLFHNLADLVLKHASKSVRATGTGCHSIRAEKGAGRVITQRLLAWELRQSLMLLEPKPQGHFLGLCLSVTHLSDHLPPVSSTALSVCVSYLILRSCLESRLLQRWRFRCCSLALF